MVHVSWRSRICTSRSHCIRIRTLTAGGHRASDRTLRSTLSTEEFCRYFFGKCDCSRSSKATPLYLYFSSSNNNINNYNDNNYNDNNNNNENNNKSINSNSNNSININNNDIMIIMMIIIMTINKL